MQRMFYFLKHIRETISWSSSQDLQTRIEHHSKSWKRRGTLRLQGNTLKTLRVKNLASIKNYFFLKLISIIGGNISNVACDSNTTLSYFMANYTLLANCSALVDEKCNVSGPGPDVIAAMVKCNVEMEKTKTFTDGIKEIWIKRMKMFWSRLSSVDHRWSGAMWLLGDCKEG